MLIDHLEKAGRLVLWLTISVSIAGAAIATVQARSDAEEHRSELEEAKKKLSEALVPKPPAGPVRLAVQSMKPITWALDPERARATINFSNVSSTKGVACLTITVVQESSGEKLTSSATCRPVEAYESGVSMHTSFAGADFKQVCGAKPCRLDTFTDVKDNPPPILIP